MQYNDGRKFCTRCGVQVVAGESVPQTAMPVSPQQHLHQPQYVQPTASPRSTNADEILRLIAFILNIISAIFVGTMGLAWLPLLIALAWMVPMTVHSWGIYQGKVNNTVVFGVCTLLFCNVVSGILLLVSTKDQ